MVARESEFNALKLVREAASLQSLEQAIGNFAFQAPNSPLVNDFAEVAGEAKFWQKSVAWNEFIDTIANYLRTRDGAVAGDLLAKYNAIEQAISPNPILESSPNLKSVLEKMAERNAILDKLVATLDKDTRSSLYTLEAPTRVGLEPLRFYAYSSYASEKKQRDILAKSSSKGIEVIAADDGTVASETLAGVVSVREDPQKLYNELLSSFNQQRSEYLSKWEAKFLEQIALVFKRPNLDHMLKEHLILALLRASAEGSDYLARRQKDNILFLSLRESKIKSTWFEPASPKSQLDNEVTTRINPALSKSMQELRLVDEPLRTLANSKLYWVGSINRDATGQFQAAIVKQPRQLAIVHDSSKA